MDYHKNFVEGDRVIVGCEEDIRHCCHGYSSDMFDYANMEAFVTRVSEYGYSIDIDHGEWAWCDKTLFPASVADEDLEPVEDLFTLLGGSL